MASPRFSPGFRFSAPDAVLLIATAMAGIYFYPRLPWASAGMIFVVAHFFLFCNVFRIPRKPELIWAGCFLLLACVNIMTGMPGWIAVYAICLVVSGILIAMETKKPGYHGVLWEKWNPNLPEWWRARHLKQGGPGKPLSRPVATKAE